MLIPEGVTRDYEGDALVVRSASCPGLRAALSVHEFADPEPPHRVYFTHAILTGDSEFADELVRSDSIFGRAEVWDDCPDCEGDGRVGDESCPECEGDRVIWQPARSMEHWLECHPALGAIAAVPVRVHNYRANGAEIVPVEIVPVEWGESADIMYVERKHCASVDEALAGIGYGIAETNRVWAGEVYCLGIEVDEDTLPDGTSVEDAEAVVETAGLNYCYGGIIGNDYALEQAITALERLEGLVEVERSERAGWEARA